MSQSALKSVVVDKCFEGKERNENVEHALGMLPEQLPVIYSANSTPEPVTGDTTNHGSLNPTDKQNFLVTRLHRFLFKWRRRQVSPVDEPVSVTMDQEAHSLEDASTFKAKSDHFTQTTLGFIQYEIGLGHAHNNCGEKNKTRNVDGRNIRLKNLKKLMTERLVQNAVHAAEPKLKYMHSHMNILYMFGLSPIQPQDMRNRSKCAKATQQAVYWSLSSLALLKGCLDMKLAWLTFRSKKNVINFVYFGYHLISIITRVKMVRSLVATSNSPSANIEVPENTWKPNEKKNGDKSVPALLLVLSLIAAIATVAFLNLPHDRWSIENVQLVHSYQTSQDLYLWSPKNMTEKSVMLDDLYATNLTNKVILLASTGNVLQFCGTLYENILIDLFLVLALEVHQLQSKLIADIESCIGLTFESKPRIAIAWQLYTKAREICEGLNHVFGPLLKMIHTQNMFNLAYLMFQILTNEKTTFMFLMSIYDAAKLAFAYRLVKKCADKNEKLESIVVTHSKNCLVVDICGKPRSVSLLLREIKKHPIGLGRGEFFVDEAFVLKMVSAIGTLFILLTEQASKPEE